jgi:hypothetical protein
MTTAVDLVYETDEAPLGAIVGTVDILDAGLRRISGAVVRVRVPVPVVLPSRGQFFASGRLASGVRVAGALTLSLGSPPRRWRLEPQRSPERGMARGKSAVGWLAGWSCRAGRWRADVPLGVQPGPDRTDIDAGSPAGPGDVVVVQVAAAGAPARMCVVPPKVLLRTAPAARDGGLELVPPPGVAQTLLRQLQWGDTIGAGVIVEHVLAEQPHGPAGDPLLDLLIGYLLLRPDQDPERRYRWAEALVARRPASIDAAVIRVAARLADDRSASAEAAASTAAEAAADLLDTGLPVFREGLRLLVDLLELGAGRFHRPDRLRTAHRYLQCAHPTTLTTFYGGEPDAPSPVPKPAQRPEGAFVTLEPPRPARASRAVRWFPVAIRGFATLGDPAREPTRSGALEFPAGLRALLGARAVGSASLRRGTFHIVVDRVDPAALGEVRIVAVVDDTPVPLARRGTTLIGSLPGLTAPPGSLTFEVHPADEA